MPKLSAQSQHPLIKPKELLAELALTQQAQALVEKARSNAEQIMCSSDDRLLVIIGPCSIHDPIAALEYANLLRRAADRYADDLYFIMRTYFEKPRTTVGWKGLINDPHLNNSFDIHHGLKLARQLLLELHSLKMPAATEFLDSMIPLYIGDLISWCAIGARTSASQLHRELASGLPMPVGFKNSIDGNVTIAIDAVQVAAHEHHFLGATTDGTPAIIHTEGNKACHVVLRGSQQTSNYDPHHVRVVAHALQEAHIHSRIMIDCSHGNSMKNHLRQQEAIHSIAEQVSSGSYAIGGVMLESHLVSGKQTLGTGSLIYGQSITDGCISWRETEPLLEKLALATKKRVTQKKSATPAF